MFLYSDSHCTICHDIIEDDLSPTYRASHILLTQKYAHNARKTYYFLQEKFYSNLFILILKVFVYFRIAIFHFSSISTNLNLFWYIPGIVPECQRVVTLNAEIRTTRTHKGRIPTLVLLPHPSRHRLIT